MKFPRRCKKCNNKIKRRKKGKCIYCKTKYKKNKHQINKLGRVEVLYFEITKEEHDLQILAMQGQRNYVYELKARKAGVPHIPYDFEEICNEYGNKCLCCGQSKIDLTRDHIIPFENGGSDSKENIQPLCRSCNSKKGNRHFTDYRPDAGRLCTSSI